MLNLPCSMAKSSAFSRISRSSSIMSHCNRLNCLTAGPSATIVEAKAALLASLVSMNSGITSRLATLRRIPSRTTRNTPGLTLLLGKSYSIPSLASRIVPGPYFLWCFVSLVNWFVVCTSELLATKLEIAIAPAWACLRIMAMADWIVLITAIFR